MKLAKDMNLKELTKLHGKIRMANLGKNPCIIISKGMPKLEFQ